MSNRKYTWNAYESTLNGAINTAAVVIPLTYAADLRAPGILVIDPDDPVKREFISFATKNGSSLEGVTRNLDGGVLSAHDDGAIIRAVPVHQFFDDIFTDIETLESADSAHSGAGNPHSDSASSTDLATTDGNVATNAVDIATNAADLVTHEADTDLHSPVDIEDAYSKVRSNQEASFEMSAAAGWEEVAGVTMTNVTVPSDWNTYDLLVRAGGQIDSPSGSGAECRVRADIPGATTVGETPFVGGTGQRYVGFTIDARHGSTITRTTVPNVTVRLEVNANTDTTWISAAYLTIELRRRS